MADIEVTSLDSPSSLEEVESSNMVFFDPTTGAAKRLPTAAVLNPQAPILTEAVDPASADVAYLVQDNTTGEWLKVLGSNLPAGGGGGGWLTKANLEEKIAQDALTNPDGSVYYQEAGVGAVWFPRIRIPIISTTDDMFVTCRNFYHNDISGTSDPETSFSIHDEWILLNTSAEATSGSQITLMANQPRAKLHQNNLVTNPIDNVFTFGGTPNIELAVANLVFYFPDGSFVANAATHGIMVSVDICGMSFQLGINFSQTASNNWFFINNAAPHDLGIAAASFGIASFRVEMDSVAEEVRVYQGTSNTPLVTQPFSNMSITSSYSSNMNAAIYLNNDALGQVSFGVSQFGVIMTAV